MSKTAPTSLVPSPLHARVAPPLTVRARRTRARTMGDGYDDTQRLSRAESSSAPAMTMSRAQSLDSASANYTPSSPELVGGVVGGKETDVTLMRLQRMSAFESHDYDPMDNDLEEDALRGRSREDYRREMSWKWFTSVLIGLAMGFIAFVVDGLVDKLNLFRYGVIGEKVGVDGMSRFVAYLAHVSVSCAFAAVAGGLVSYVEPLAAGSGIPELKTYLNGVHLKGLLRLKTVVAKLGGISFSIGAGLIAGKEGPFVHGGGLVGGGIAAFGSNTLGFKTKRPAWFRNDRDKRDFVAIGTATGVAVAFAAPIGGMLFTVEEGASFYNSDMLWRGFLATCTGVLTMHWLEQLDFDASDFARARFGTHRDFGLYTDNEADYSKQYWWYFWEVPIFLLMGAAGGLMGSAFVNLNVKITALRAKYIPVGNKRKRLLEVIAIAGITSTLFFFFMSISPCKDIPLPLQAGTTDSIDTAAANATFEYGVETRDEIREDFFKQLYCPEGQYSVYGQLFFTPLSQSFKFLLHLGEVGEFGQDKEHPFPLSALIWYFLLTFSLMTVTYGVGAPTGLFVPSLAVGASFGQICGRIVSAVAARHSRDIEINLHAYAIIGAAASLGGATRMTISITVLVMETTGSMQLIIPLMLTIFAAKHIGDKYTLGIYDTHIKIRGAPFLEEPELAGPCGDKLRVSEVMSDDLVTLEPIMRVSELLKVLIETNHGAYPVTDAPPTHSGEEFELHGSITRNVLLKMLLHRISFVDPQNPLVGNNLFTSPRERDDLLEQLKQIPFKVPSAREVAQRVAQSDVDTMCVDLRSFMQRHPFVVHGDARLSRAYRSFRTLGLRHMYVMPARPRVVGVLTRKDVIHEKAALQLGLYARGLSQPPRAVSRTFEPVHAAPDVAHRPRASSHAHATDDAEHEHDEHDASLPYIPYYVSNVVESTPSNPTSDTFTSIELIDRASRGAVRRRDASPR